MIARQHSRAHPQVMRISPQAAIKVFEANGKIKDHGVERRLKQVGQQVVRFAYLHTSKQAIEFLHQWVCQPVKPRPCLSMVIYYPI